jgi:hypothetical protein
MNADARLTLGEIASRLRGYNRFKKTTTGGRRELLKLLQLGEISAVFDFPSLARPSITIAREFWIDVHSGDFNNQLVWKAKRNGRSQYLLEPVKFVDQYVRWFADHHPHLQNEFSSRALAELTSALTNVNAKKECSFSKRSGHALSMRRGWSR